MGGRQELIMRCGALLGNTSVERFASVAGYIRRCRKCRLEYLHKVRLLVRMRERREPKE